MSNSNTVLGVEGQEDGGGLEITASTTLRDVRDKFPVPSEYAFAVPTQVEKTQLASDYLPLVLLKVSDTRGPTLVARKPGDSERVRKLEHEVERLQAELVAERESAGRADGQLQLELTSQRRLLADATEQLAQATSERDTLAGRLMSAEHERDALRNAATRRGNGAAARSAQLCAEPPKLREELNGLRSAAQLLRRDLERSVEEARQQMVSEIGRSSLASLRRQETLQRQRDGDQQQQDRHADSLAADLADSRSQASQLASQLSDAQQALVNSRATVALLEATVNKQAGAGKPAGNTHFSQYIELSREIATLTQAGRDFFGQPADPKVQDSFISSLQRLTEISAKLRSGGSKGGPATAIPNPGPLAPAPAPAAPDRPASALVPAPVAAAAGQRPTLWQGRSTHGSTSQRIEKLSKSPPSPARSSSGSKLPAVGGRVARGIGPPRSLLKS